MAQPILIPTPRLQTTLLLQVAMIAEYINLEKIRYGTRVFTEKGFIITRQTIAAVEAMLSNSLLIRILRAYVVSLNKIKSFTHETVEIGNKELPVGKLYRNNFLKLQGN